MSPTLKFCHPEIGRPLDRSKLTRRFKEALVRAEVHAITFHELRHTFGTRMAAAGTPLRTLQHWMGHADSKTTQVYAHYQPSENEVDTVDQPFRERPDRARRDGHDRRTRVVLYQDTWVDQVLDPR